MMLRTILSLAAIALFTGTSPAGADEFGARFGNQGYAALQDQRSAAQEPDEADIIRRLMQLEPAAGGDASPSQSSAQESGEPMHRVYSDDNALKRVYSE